MVEQVRLDVLQPRMVWKALICEMVECSKIMGMDDLVLDMMTKAWKLDKSSENNLIASLIKRRGS